MHKSGMRQIIAAAILCVLPTFLPAQKVDSLLLHISVPKERAAELVVQAFVHAGLTVTNTTSLLIEADEGSTRNLAAGGETRRVVRAILLPSDSTTDVLITGIENRIDQYGRTYKRLRIDNRAGGNGAKVWKKMVDAAMALDSTAVPDAARTH